MNNTQTMNNHAQRRRNDSYTMGSKRQSRLRQAHPTIRHPAHNQSTTKENPKAYGDAPPTTAPKALLLPQRPRHNPRPLRKRQEIRPLHWQRTLRTSTRRAPGPMDIHQISAGKIQHKALFPDDRRRKIRHRRKPQASRNNKLRIRQRPRPHRPRVQARRHIHDLRHQGHIPPLRHRPGSRQTSHLLHSKSSIRFSGQHKHRMDFLALNPSGPMLPSRKTHG